LLDLPGAGLALTQLAVVAAVTAGCLRAAAGGGQPGKPDEASA
jgi:hypothetical protein